MVDISKETQHKATPPPAGYYPAQYQGDEIDLLDIWRVLVRQRKWILVITLIFALGAVRMLSLYPRYIKQR